MALRSAPAHQPEAFAQSVQPFVKRNCLGCHNTKSATAGVNLSPFTSAEAAAAQPDVWESVLERVKAGSMPPPPLPRPKGAEVEGFTHWVEGMLAEVERTTKPDPGRVTARRLNRAEYNNTIRDLFGVDLRPADDFPGDDSGYGFDNIGDVLSLSPVLMEKYLVAAHRVTDRVIYANQPPAKPTFERVENRKLANPSYNPKKRNFEQTLPAPVMRVSRDLDAPGDYDVRVRVRDGRSDKMQLGHVVLAVDGVRKKLFDIQPPARPRDDERALEYDVRIRIPAGSHEVTAYALDDAGQPITSGVDANRLSVPYVEFRGPFNPGPRVVPASHRRLFTCGHAFNRHTEACARRILAPLARRAYRRPVTTAEVNALLRFVREARQDGEPFEAGVQLAVQAVLISPNFLFRIERDSARLGPDGTHRVSDLELASRLSYFLWSSTPDEALLRTAELGRLHQPAVLKTQVARMLRDPKSAALVENFAGQWLQLRNLKAHQPDPELFPAFDDDLRAAMGHETELFLQAIIREDRSVFDLFTADFTYLNDRLAAHYGIAGVTGPEFRRVTVDGVQRGGILGHASVLTVSSYATRTSPVVRGVWVLENLIGSPPPPPPPGVPELDTKDLGASTTLRQRMEIHRTNPTCASCHAKMDPIGFGLESYDAIGRWRSTDGTLPLDTSGTLPNGKAFNGPAELKAALASDRDPIARNMAEKMLTFALGRGLERYDRPAVKAIVQGMAAHDYRFSSLVDGIVQSLPFRMRRALASPSVSATLPVGGKS